MTNEGMNEIEKHDPLLSIEDLTIKGREYAGIHNVKEWCVSPMYGDLTGLPPIFVDCGTHEIFYADVMKMEEMVKTSITAFRPKGEDLPGQGHFASIRRPEAVCEFVYFIAALAISSAAW